MHDESIDPSEGHESESAGKADLRSIASKVSPDASASTSVETTTTGAGFRTGDLLGGMASTGVALPQSMALGVALFVGMGFDAAAGALAGLIGAAVLSLASGIRGATIGMISAPNGPVVMLLTTSLAAVAAEGISGDGLLLALVAILTLTGVFQFLLGVAGGGQLIRFIPYPAVAGIVTSVGLAMVLSQTAPLSGTDALNLGGAWVAFPGAVAIATFAAIKLMPRILPFIPGIVSGLMVGIALFHIGLLLLPAPVPEAWLVGRIPTIGVSALHIEFSAFTNLPWRTILISAAALAIIASVDCLLTAVVADTATGERHDARRELMAQGIGQLLTGLLGGVGGGGTKGSTLVDIKIGGRRWAALVAGVTFAMLILFLGPVGMILPLSALSGVLIYVGVGLFEWHILYWLRNRRTRVDGIVALLVVATTLAFGLMDGVAVGVFGSIILLLRNLVGARVIHEHATGKEYRSLRLRTEQESRLLDEHGGRIVYVELRGNLFFGTTDRLFNELLSDLDRPVWMILNMRRVQYLDLSGLHLFQQMIRRLDAHGGQMLYSNVRRSAVTERKMNKLLKWLGPEHDLPKTKTFRSTDAALEYAENALLTALGHPPKPTFRRVEADDNELFRRMKPKTRQAIKAAMRPLSLKRKQSVFDYGEPGDALYLMLEGQVELRLPTRVYHYKRLGKLGPGTYFGGAGFLDPGPRSATAFVTQDVKLLVFDRTSMEHLARKQQRDAGQAVLYELGASQSRSLRLARAELRRLERW